MGDTISNPGDINKEPLVSIIMPAYNASNTIMESINSVLEQTYTNYEIIVINDASTDNTLNIISNITDKRLIVLDLEKNGGVAKARNAGIEKAGGEYIAFLDSDDVWLPTKLEEQIAFMIKNNKTFTYTDYYVMGTYSNRSAGEKKRKADSRIDFKKLKKGNQIGCLTVVVKSDIMKRYLMPEIRHEDYGTWLKVLKEEGIYAYNVGKCLARYRVHGGSLSGNKIKAATWQWNIYRSFLKLGFFESLYYFFFYVVNGILKRI